MSDTGSLWYTTFQVARKGNRALVDDAIAVNGLSAIPVSCHSCQFFHCFFFSLRRRENGKLRIKLRWCNAEPFTGTWNPWRCRGSFTGDMERTKITRTLCSAWAFWGTYPPLPFAPANEIGGDRIDPGTSIRFLHPLSFFCFCSYFFNHFASPVSFFSYLLLHLLFPHPSFNRKKQNKTSLFCLSSNVNRSCFYAFTYVLVLLFTRSLLSAVSVVGTALGSGHTVVHQTYSDHSRMGLTVKRVI